MGKVETALDATEILRNLRMDLNRLPYTPDLHRFLNNLDGLASELSKLEVYARRAGPRSRYNVSRIKLRDQLNQSIIQLNDMVLMLRIMS